MTGQPHPSDARAPSAGSPGWATSLQECAEDARRTLAAWHPTSAPQDDLRQRFLAFLAEHGAQAVDRDLRVGHLTASIVLLDHTREHVLLTLHGLLGAWVQLGGHVEPEDRSMVQAAAREAHEESGIAGSVVDPQPLGIDWHAVRCRDSGRRIRSSQHLDVTYLAIAPAGAVPVRSDESEDLAWFGVQALPDAADATLRRLVDAARQRS
ncbi:MAG TPA: NUDIX domain-containing protein [Candidatus Nanopelagicales bacterium]